MTRLPSQFVLLNPSVFQSLASCLRELPVPRYTSLFFMLDKSVAIHDGHGVIGVGPENSDIYKCLESAMGDKSDGVIVVDRNERQAWWAPTADATDFLARNNAPPHHSRADDAAGKLVH
jgi:hypothetical protein